MFLFDPFWLIIMCASSTFPHKILPYFAAACGAAFGLWHWALTKVPRASANVGEPEMWGNLWESKLD